MLTDDGEHFWFHMHSEGTNDSCMPDRNSEHKTLEQTEESPFPGAFLIL